METVSLAVSVTEYKALVRNSEEKEEEEKLNEMVVLRELKGSRVAEKRLECENKLLQPLTEEVLNGAARKVGIFQSIYNGC